jgi:hypothetical protein
MLTAALVVGLMGLIQGSVAPPVQASLSWSLAPRYGSVLSANGTIAETPLDRPWKIILDACASGPSSSVSAITLRLEGFPDAAGGPTACTAAFTYVGPPGRTLRAEVIVLGTGGDVATATADVSVEDHLVVSIGDSYASGEGNPDVPRKVHCTFYGLICHVHDPVWQDGRCHRSANSGPAIFAKYLEASDPHSTVSFVSRACSGAEVWDGLLGAQHPDRPAQVDQIASVVCQPGADGLPSCAAGVKRRIDTLLLSIGGNDLQLAGFVKNCLQATLDPTNPLCPYGSFREAFEAYRLALPGRFDALAAGLSKLDGAVGRVLLTEYPQATRVAPQTYCTLIDEAICVHDPLSDSCLTPALRLDVTPRESASAQREMIQPLGLMMRDGAARHGWGYVGGIAAESITHGMCSSSRWFLTNAQARSVQGTTNEVPVFFDGISNGFLHPNSAGHGAYASWIADAVAGPLDVAVADPSLGAPACGEGGPRCSSGTLLVGRGALGPEAAAPSTIAASCPDGAAGLFHVDRSIDAVEVASLDGGELAPGRLARVTVRLFSSADPTQDVVDLYWASGFIQPPGVALPAWQPVATLAPTQAGLQVLEATVLVPQGYLHAIRARLHSPGDAGACGAGAMDDVDDLVFPVRQQGAAPN